VRKPKPGAAAARATTRHRDHVPQLRPGAPADQGGGWSAVVRPTSITTWRIVREYDGWLPPKDREPVVAVLPDALLAFVQLIVAAHTRPWEPGLRETETTALSGSR
jgi:hypothetical protein